MPRLRRKAGIRSERHGAKRRVAIRFDEASGRTVDEGSGATEQWRRKDEVLLSAQASEARSERQRAEAPGIVTRRAKTAKRASWSRAGRSRARRNRARRPVRRTGRAPGSSDPRTGRYRSDIYPDGRGLTGWRDRGLAERNRERMRVGGEECGDAESGCKGVVDGGARSTAAKVVRGTASQCAEEGAAVAGKEGAAGVRRGRVSVERDTRQVTKKGPTRGTAGVGP